MSDQNDETLFEAWQQGDKKAGEILFERYFDSMLRFFRNKVGDDVEDLVQETFFACFRSKQAFRGECSFRTYLFQAARSKLYAHLSKRRRDDERLDFGHSSVADLRISAPSLLIQQAELRLLAVSLRQLPVDIQMSLELFYFERMGGREIAAVFGVSEGTIRSRLRRGKELLRERIQKSAETKRLFQSTVENLDAWVREMRHAINDRVEGEPLPLHAATKTERLAH